MLGAVGAYSWSGTVVHQTGYTVDILPSSAFKETLQDNDHSSLLGTHQSTVVFSEKHTHYFNDSLSWSQFNHCSRKMSLHRQFCS